MNFESLYSKETTWERSKNSPDDKYTTLKISELDKACSSRNTPTVDTNTQNTEKPKFTENLTEQINKPKKLSGAQRRKLAREAAIANREPIRYKRNDRRDESTRKQNPSHHINNRRTNRSQQGSVLSLRESIIKSTTAPDSNRSVSKSQKSVDEALSRRQSNRSKERTETMAEAFARNQSASQIVNIKPTTSSRRPVGQIANVKSTAKRPDRTETMAERFARNQSINQNPNSKPTVASRKPDRSERKTETMAEKFARIEREKNRNKSRNPDQRNRDSSLYDSDKLSTSHKSDLPLDRNPLRDRSCSPDYRRARGDPPIDISYDIAGVHDVHVAMERSHSRDNERRSYSRSSRDSRPVVASYDCDTALQSSIPFRERSRSRERVHISHSGNYEDSRRYDTSLDRNQHRRRSNSPEYGRDTDMNPSANSNRHSPSHGADVYPDLYQTGVFGTNSRGSNNLYEIDRDPGLYGKSYDYSVFQRDNNSPIYYNDFEDFVPPFNSQRTEQNTIKVSIRSQMFGSSIGNENLGYRINSEGQRTVADFEDNVTPFNYERTEQNTNRVSMRSQVAPEDSSDNFNQVDLRNRMRNTTNSHNYSNSKQSTSGKSNKLETKTRVGDPNNLKVVIMHRLFPEILLTEAHVGDIEMSAIAHIKSRDEGSGPQFHGITCDQGRVIVTCKNVESKSWLEDIIPKLQTRSFGFGFLRTTTSTYVEEFGETAVKAIMWAPNQMASKSPATLLNLLKTQNEGLQTKNWRIVGITKKKEDELKVILYIDRDSETVLQRFNMRPCLGLGKANFKIIKPRSENSK